MALPRYGYAEGIGIARETAYGTVNDVLTVSYYPNEFSLTRKDPLNELSGPTGTLAPWLFHSTKSRGFLGIPDISGSLTVDADYDDIGHFLGNAVAVPAAASVVDVTANAHVFTQLKTKPTAMPPSFTMVHDGDDVSTLDALQYGGCAIQRLTLTASASQAQIPVQLSMDIVAQRGGAANYTTDSFTVAEVSTAPWLEFSECMVAWHSTPGQSRASLTNQTSGLASGEVTITIENFLRISAATGGTVRGIREPLYEKARRCTISFSKDFTDTQFWSDMQSATLTDRFAALAVKFTSPTIIVGSATPFSLDVYFPYGVIQDNPVTYGGGPDLIPERVTYVASTNGTTDPSIWTLVNGTSTSYWQ